MARTNTLPYRSDRLTHPTPKRPRTGARVAGVLLTLVALAVGLVLAWPQVFGLQRAMFVAQAVSFRVPWILGSLGLLAVLLVVLVAWRRARVVLAGTCVVLAVFAASVTAIVLDRGVTTEAIPAASETDVRVLVWNTRGDEPGSPTIAQLAVEYEADVVVLPETTEPMGEEVAVQMRELGYPMWVHTRTLDEDYKWTSTTLLISPRLGEYEVVDVPDEPGDLPTIVAAPVSGDGPTIVGAHPTAPIPSQMSNWRAGLDWLSARCSGDAIVAGDFNATLDHMAGLESEPVDAREDFRAVFGECADAGLDAGGGELGTWRASLPTVIAAPIDHVMATQQWRTVGFEVITSVDEAGSDHRPVFAQLSPVT